MAELSNQNPERNREESDNPLSELKTPNLNPAEEFRGTSLARFLAAYVEDSFQQELRIADPALISYISEVFLNTVRIDSVYAFLATSSTPLDTHAALMGSVPQDYPDNIGRGFQLIADGTLYYCSVASKSLNRLEDNTAKSLRERGKEAYKIAYDILRKTPSASAIAPILLTVRDNFDACCYGLRTVQDSWQRDAAADGQSALLL